MAERGAADSRGSILSPLGVISLFLSFSEVVLGYAVTRTDGWIQGALTAFVILFPIGICIAFFRILWVKPFVFYPPSEFGPDTDVTEYVEAMSAASRPKPVADTIKAKIEQALRPEELGSMIAPLVITSPDRDHAKSVRELLDLVRGRVEDSVKTAFVRIDSTPRLGPTGPIWDEAYEPDLPVFAFLDSIWRHLQPHVGPFTYSVEWVLRDVAGNRILRDLGRPWARPRGLREDERRLSQVGIRPGTTMEVVRP
jgi:hypothetical protein